LVLDAHGVPELHLTPSDPDRIKELQIYQCLKAANNVARAWRDVESVRKGDTWIAKLPVLNVDDYVFGYANVRYDNNCVVSSDFEAAIPSRLGDARATDKKSNQLSEGTGQWTHVGPAEGVGGIKGFRPLDNRRGTSTKQFADPKWQAPKDAALSFQFYCTQPQALRLQVGRHFSVDLEITASNDWQSMVIPSSQVKNSHGGTLKQWSEATSLTIKPKPGADITKVVFANFKWAAASKPVGTVNETPKVTPKADAQGRTYLTKDMTGKAETFWRVMEDKSVEGKQKISVGGKSYERGLGVHADSHLEFLLDGKYKSFHVVPGPDDAHRGIIEMKILIDDKEVFNSGKVSSNGYRAKALNLPVTGAKKLTLLVTDGGNGRGGDHASWADAYLR
jgi:hypothetical protein